MNPLIEEYQAEHPDRNIWGNLDISEIFAYLNQDSNAPTPQEVFDHYWSILEYALSDDEKVEIRTMTPKEGVKRLLALGGSVWNVRVTVDLLGSYDYLQKDLLLEDAVGVYKFILPKRPIDTLRAGVVLGKDMSGNVLDQRMCDRRIPVLVYKKEILVDSLDVEAFKQTINVLIEDDSGDQQANQELIDAEEEWAKKHSLKWRQRRIKVKKWCVMKNGQKYFFPVTP